MSQSLRKALWTCADLKIYSLGTFECFVPRLLFPRLCSITTFSCFPSLLGESLWWDAVTLLSVYIRRKSNAGVVALQECCPPACPPPPSCVCPIRVLIHCFPLSLLFVFFYIPSCLCFNNYSLRTLTFYGISHFSFHSCSVPQFFDFFFPSLQRLKLRSDHTLISLLSSSLPPPPSLYPWSKFFPRLTQTSQR